MKILIVYDSVFGNTKKVASMIFDAFEKDHEVTIEKACDAKQVDLSDVDLLVIGSPTRAFTCTKIIKEFVSGLPKHMKTDVAVFDTRMDIDKIDNKFLTFMAGRFGYSNDTLFKIFKRKGMKSVASEYFVVQESEGPLVAGVEQKAKDFVMHILSNIG